MKGQVRLFFLTLAQLCSSYSIEDDHDVISRLQQIKNDMANGQDISIDDKKAAVSDLVNILRPFNFWEQNVANNLTLNSSYGPIKGVLRKFKWNYSYKLSNRNAEDPLIETYYQIPYAKAERFEDPGAYPTWTNGIYDGTKFDKEKHCLFREYGGFGAWHGNENDCLRLTLHRPYNTINKETKDRIRKPLIVWIHGGSYNWGAGNGQSLLEGNHYFYEPAALVHYGDIIFAALNYQMNSFGGFDTNDMAGSPGPKGNIYLKDCLFAINWLIENSENFGFDEKLITIMGHSAGGSLTSWMGALDGLNGKIKNLIPMSGSMAMFFGYQTEYVNHSNGANARDLASRLHCYYPNGDDIKNCIKNSRDWESALQLRYSNLTWRPNRDNDLIYKEEKSQFLENTGNSHGVNLFIGDNVGDSWGFALSGDPLVNQIKDIIFDLTDQVVNDEDYLPQFMEHLILEYNEETKEKAEKRGLIKGIQGMVFTYGALEVANLHIQGKKLANMTDTLNTYTYRIYVRTILDAILERFGLDSALSDLFGCDEIEHTCGTLHGEELIYFLGQPLFRTSALLSTDILFNIHDKSVIKMTERLLQALTNFVWTGNPNNDQKPSSRNPKYPLFDLEDPKRIDFKAVKDTRGDADEINDHDNYDDYDSWTASKNLPKIRMADCGYGAYPEGLEQFFTNRSAKNDINRVKNRNLKANLTKQNFANKKLKISDLTLIKYAHQERFEMSKIIENISRDSVDDNYRWGWIRGYI